MDDLDRALIARLQRGIAVTERPFAPQAAALGISEHELLDRIERLLGEGVLTRFGPMYAVESFGGAFTLAALSAPDADFERIAALVNAHPEVAHNYRREHALNMWFVLAAERPAEIPVLLATIASETGCEVLEFPKLDEYFVELQLAPQ